MWQRGGSCEAAKPRVIINGWQKVLLTPMSFIPCFLSSSGGCARICTGKSCFAAQTQHGKRFNQRSPMIGYGYQLITSCRISSTADG